MTEPQDRCPSCPNDLGRQVFYSDLAAGDTVECDGCHSRFVITEHDNGWQGWYTFEASLAAAGKPQPDADEA